MAIFLFLCGSQPVSGDQIFVNIQEGFALIYRLCLRNKNIAEGFFAQVLIVLLTAKSFYYFAVIS